VRSIGALASYYLYYTKDRYSSLSSLNIVVIL